ncbi:MAG: hypothetical protein UU64_C0004G0016 [candidate division WWE3 bacterium GW2011_GWF2_41_45]|uniref:Uncharacterized protein n=2 Tax=Katanobacteria TaxID=422282 RepID=A0A0G0YRD2_UNCKA|nr:MAG: hypothetical protein UU55_C0007G0003 [candidate division WWE3 bacterium GW2011_GWC2_41_23]KKS10419.1 MAG: hypothetical protein UU64_C0004G0016 [candidate division WWE3 bacterium GW2011_GWF2_41_45]KKS12047.1 MAG: hypothetical protein UU68_C0006G0016 [candidate division WWE3 bacterium GW2011_GWF1_41_53]KKS20069.1 MAG: hypothetical protein UU79_C0004G0016 [candidate division WWE3 bacterium GW2011_GWE1_41_72]KKS29450.1 MAG: hypothetical protein UU90_C0009G0003 [candidate division WWE3 bacte
MLDTKTKRFFVYPRFFTHPFLLNGNIKLNPIFLINLRIVSEVVNIQFYNLKTKEKVEIPDSEIEIVTLENGRKAAKAVYNGMKLFKFLSKADSEKLAA